jgi:hypothetical protein
MSSPELQEKLVDLRRVFDLEKISSLSIDKEYIQKYYKVNQMPYSIFHTKSNLIHMGISRGGAIPGR